MKLKTKAMYASLAVPVLLVLTTVAAEAPKWSGVRLK